MKKTVLVTILLVACCVGNTLNAQVDDFESYKKKRKAAFENYKSEQDSLFKAFVEDQKKWNKMLLGDDHEEALLAESEEGNTATPVYVDTKTTKKTEIEKINKENLLIKEELEEPEEEEVDKESLLDTKMRYIPHQEPIKKSYRLSSPFGYRTHPITKKKQFHSGVDMACCQGTPVSAPAEGTVVYADFSGSYGNYVIIDHGNGYKTVYAHLQKIDVKKNQRIKLNQTIGRVGSTGASTGAHLHYEIVKDQKKVNPQDFF